MTENTHEDLHNNDERNSTELEKDQDDVNEYEMERASRIARNNAFLQPSVDLANALYSSLRVKKPTVQKRKRPEEGGPSRRSRRLEQVQSKNSLGNHVHEGGEDREDFGERDEGNSSSGEKSEEFQPTEGDESESLSDDTDDGRGSRGCASGDRLPNSNGRRVGKTYDETVRGVRDDSPSRHALRGSPSTTSHDKADNVTPPANVMHMPVAPGFMWVPVPQGSARTGMTNMRSGLTPGSFPMNWSFPQVNYQSNTSDFQGVENTGIERESDSKSMSLKQDSVKKRIRRAHKRDADESARQRKAAGLRPYLVQVKPSGIIDSGCAGHLKWHEYIRNLTPRMLDMSVIKYEDQYEDSKVKLRDALRAKFEFVDHDVTDASLDRMVKTWMRKDRDRMKRRHGGKLKAPSRYTEKEWDALKKHWGTPSAQEESEKMVERRKKVVNNPRVGRRGYAGNAAKLRKERENSPGVTDVANELRTAKENPSSTEMEKKNSQRLSAMEKSLEKNQEETNKRLVDVMQSNLDLRSMLQSFISSLSNSDALASAKLPRTGSTKPGESSFSDPNPPAPVVANSSAPGSSERWWDRLCKSSEEEDEEDASKKRQNFSKKPREQKKHVAVDRNRGMGVLPVTVDPKGIGKASGPECQTTINQEKKTGTPAPQDTTLRQNIEFQVGDKVKMSNTLYPEITVASGTILGLGGAGVFHGRPIPPQYVRITLEKVHLNQPLMVPVEQADQVTLEDAVGSSVLWSRELTSLEN